MRWLGVVFLASVCCPQAFPQGSPALPNDNFAQRQIVGPAERLVTGSNVGATVEPGEPETEGTSVWWTWTPTETGTILISTVGSSFDTILDVFTGETLDHLRRIVSDDDSGGKRTSRLYFRAYAGEVFQIRVSGASAESGSILLHLDRPQRSISPWQMRDPTRATIRSVDFTNRVMLVDFFETTCGGCVDEADDLVAVQKKLQSRGFSMIAIATDNELQEDALGYFKGLYNINYPMGFVDYTLISSFGEVQGLPYKVLVDRESKMVATRIGGGVTNDYLSMIEPLLRSAPEVALRVVQPAQNLTVGWPATEFGWVVEETLGLDPAHWTTVDRPVIVANGENRVTFPRDTLRRFVRLRRKQP